MTPHSLSSRLLTDERNWPSGGRIVRSSSRKKQGGSRSAPSEWDDYVSDRKRHRFEPCLRRQKRTNFCLPKVRSFFIQAAVGVPRSECASFGGSRRLGISSPRFSVHFPAAWWYIATSCGWYAIPSELMIYKATPWFFYFYLKNCIAKQKKILIIDTLVENRTYPLFQPKLIGEAKNRGFI